MQEHFLGNMGFPSFFGRNICSPNQNILLSRDEHPCNIANLQPLTFFMQGCLDQYGRRMKNGPPPTQIKSYNKVVV